jgi:hypothetical protein
MKCITKGVIILYLLAAMIVVGIWRAGIAVRIYPALEFIFPAALVASDSKQAKIDWDRKVRQARENPDDMRY